MCVYVYVHVYNISVWERSSRSVEINRKVIWERACEGVCVCMCEGGEKEARNGRRLGRWANICRARAEEDVHSVA